MAMSMDQHGALAGRPQTPPAQVVQIHHADKPRCPTCRRQNTTVRTDGGWHCEACNIFFRVNW